MNPSLGRALSELNSAGAKGLPSAAVVEKAANKSKWQGKKADGSEWELIKNNADSYNCRC